MVCDIKIYIEQYGNEILVSFRFDVMNEATRHHHQSGRLPPTSIRRVGVRWCGLHQSMSPAQDGSFSLQGNGCFDITRGSCTGM